MRIARNSSVAGVIVWLDATECDVYRKLYEDATAAGIGVRPDGGDDFVSLSIALGQQIAEASAGGARLSSGTEIGAASGADEWPAVAVLLAE